MRNLPWFLLGRDFLPSATLFLSSLHDRLLNVSFSSGHSYNTLQVHIQSPNLSNLIYNIIPASNQPLGGRNNHLQIKIIFNLSTFEKAIQLNRDNLITFFFPQ